MLRLPAFRVTMSIPVPLSYICQDLQPINERPFQRLQGLARDLDCGVVTGVVTSSVDGVLRPALIGCNRVLNASNEGARLAIPHPSKYRYNFISRWAQTNRLYIQKPAYTSPVRRGCAQAGTSAFMCLRIHDSMVVRGAPSVSNMSLFEPSVNA